MRDLHAIDSKGKERGSLLFIRCKEIGRACQRQVLYADMPIEVSPSSDWNREISLKETIDKIDAEKQPTTSEGRSRLKEYCDRIARI